MVWVTDGRQEARGRVAGAGGASVGEESLLGGRPESACDIRLDDYSIEGGVKRGPGGAGGKEQN